MRLKVLFLVSVAALALAGCATSNITSGSIQAYGPSAVAMADGTAKASLGAIVGDLVTVPALDSKTHLPILVPGHCGSQNALSTYGSIKGAITAGTASVAGKPGVGANIGRGLATGETADLMGLAEYQQAAGPTVNAMAEWHDCGRATAPAQVDGKTAAPPPPAAGTPNPPAS